MKERDGDAGVPREAIVGGHAVAQEVEEPEVALGAREARLGGLGEPARRLLEVRAPARDAAVVEHAHLLLRGDVAAEGRGHDRRVDLLDGPAVEGLEGRRRQAGAEGRVDEHGRGLDCAVRCAAGARGSARLPAAAPRADARRARGRSAPAGRSRVGAGSRVLARVLRPTHQGRWPLGGRSLS